MIPVENITDWRGQDVLDAVGEKLGKLEEVYFDGETDEPTFAAVKSGHVLQVASRSCRSRGRASGATTCAWTGAKGEFKKAPSLRHRRRADAGRRGRDLPALRPRVHARRRGRPPPREALAPDRDEARADRGDLARGDQPLLLVAQLRARAASGRGRRPARARRGRTRAPAPRGSGRPSTGARASRRRGRRAACRCRRGRATRPRRARRARSTSNSSITSRAPWRITSDRRRSDWPSGTTWCSETIATAASNVRGGASRSSSATGSTPSRALGVDRGDVVAGVAQTAASSPSPAPISSTRAGGGGSAART